MRNGIEMIDVICVLQSTDIQKSAGDTNSSHDRFGEIYILWKFFCLENEQNLITKL